MQTCKRRKTRKDTKPDMVFRNTKQLDNVTTLLRLVVLDQKHELVLVGHNHKSFVFRHTHKAK